MRPEDDPAVLQDGAPHSEMKKRHSAVRVMLTLIIAAGVVAFAAYLAIGYIAVSSS